jgi:hypothetical protein
VKGGGEVRHGRRFGTSRPRGRSGCGGDRQVFLYGRLHRQSSLADVRRHIGAGESRNAVLQNRAVGGDLTPRLLRLRLGGSKQYRLHVAAHRVVGHIRLEGEAGQAGQHLQALGDIGGVLYGADPHPAHDGRDQEAGADQGQEFDADRSVREPARQRRTAQADLGALLAHRCRPQGSRKAGG